MRISIGDDAAAISTVGDELVVITTDMILEGTHFQLLPKVGTGKTRGATLRQVARKAVAVSLSDVAAMGLEPSALVVSVALPEASSMDFARELSRGLRAAVRRFGVDIVGGDITSWKGGLAICTTALGRDVGLKPVRRSGARMGDAILVTGKLGGSVLGKHLRFTPRLAEALFLNRHFKLHAMIDISDGLALDLSRILQASRCGALLVEKAIPIANAARRLSRMTGKSPLEHALGDGEDFELLFTLAPRELSRLRKRWRFRTTLTVLGEVTDKGFFLQRKNGALEELEPIGWEHFRKG